MEGEIGGKIFLGGEEGLEETESGGGRLSIRLPLGLMGNWLQRCWRVHSLRKLE